MLKSLCLPVLAILALADCSGIPVRAEGDKSPPPPSEERPFTQDFGEDDGDLQSTGTNPYFILEPGYVLEFDGTENGKRRRLTIRVTEETKEVAGVCTRVVEEREFSGESLIEVARHYFAISKRTNSVYWFGEEVDRYKKGKLTSHKGSWLAGQDGARYGLAMPGNALLGARFFKQIAPKARDRVEIVSLDRKVKTPAGTFEGVMKAEETTELEPKQRDYKYYAKGIGMIRDEGIRLVSHGIRENK